MDEGLTRMLNRKALLDNGAVVWVGQNSEVFIDEGGNTSAISSRSVTAKPMESSVKEFSITPMGSPLKGLPWTPYGNPFYWFVAALPQIEDQYWIENVYSKWRNTKQCTTKPRSTRLFMEFTIITWVKQIQI